VSSTLLMSYFGKQPSFLSGGDPGTLGKKLRVAVRRMNVKEDSKAALMDAIGKADQAKLHLLEGLYQNAEYLQSRIEEWKATHNNKSVVNSRSTHGLLMRLGLSTSYQESSVVFRDLDKDHSGYISLDDLTAALWEKADTEMKRLYQSTKDDSSAEAPIAPPPALTLRSPKPPQRGGSPPLLGSRGSTPNSQRCRSPSSPGSECSSAPSAVADHLRDALVEQATRVIDLFKSWDLNGDGNISKNEFFRALPELGLWAHSDEVDELFDSFDSDHSGVISFRELNRMLRRTRASDDERKSRIVKSSRDDNVEVVEMDALRKEIFKRVRTEQIHSGIEAALVNAGRGDDPLLADVGRSASTTALVRTASSTSLLGR